MDEEVGTVMARLAADPVDWFAEKLRSLLDAVTTQLPNALDPAQIEGIHDMRVATRRLRSALRDVELFLDKHPAKTASKGFKTLADKLGAVRDEDVAIDAFESLRAECDEPRFLEGISNLVDARRQRRLHAFAELKTDLSVDFQQDLRHRFETSLESLLNELQHSEHKSLRSIGCDVITSRLDELASLGVGIHDPFDRKTLHQARIATKRIRYAIDLFAECWGDAVKPFSKEFARMQGYLGDAHDRDVWMEDFYRLIKSSKHSKTGDIPELEAAAWLISEFVRERTKNYRDALRMWADWQAKRFSETLLTLIATGN
jgi:CHAD domain-containing protein